MECCVGVWGAPVQPGEWRAPVDSPVYGGGHWQEHGTFVVFLVGTHPGMGYMQSFGVATQEREGRGTEGGGSLELWKIHINTQSPQAEYVLFNSLVSHKQIRKSLKIKKGTKPLKCPFFPPQKIYEKKNK